LLFADGWWVASVLHPSDLSDRSDRSDNSEVLSEPRQLPLSICAILVRAALSREVVPEESSANLVLHSGETT
jgi:hypothetical protein